MHQVVTAFQANARSGTARAEGARRGQQVAQEALAAEGHRPRARGQAYSPLWRGGGKIFPNSPGRELLAEGQPQDVPRRHRVDPVAARARGPPLGGRELALEAPKTKLFAQKLKALGLTGTVLVITDKVDENLFLSSRNLPNVLVIERARSIR